MPDRTVSGPRSIRCPPRSLAEKCTDLDCSDIIVRII